MGGFRRKLNMENRSAFGIIFRPDFASVVVNHSFDGQEPESMAPLFCSEMLREEFCYTFFGKATTIIYNR